MTDIKTKSILWIIAILCIARILLPKAMLYGINQILDTQLEHYEGNLQDLRLSILRGEYELRDLKIYKKQNPDLAFVKIHRINVQIEWKEVLNSKVVAQVSFKNLHVNLLDSKNKDKQQFATEEKTENWEAVVLSIIPLQLNRLTIIDSSLNFRNLDFPSAEAVQIHHINAEIKNLLSVEYNENLLSPIQLSAKLGKSGTLKLNGGADLTRDPQVFDLDFEIRNLKIPDFNDTLMLYVPINFKTGEFNFLGELVGNSKNTHGYMKLFLDDLDIFQIDQTYVSGKHFVIEVLGGFSAWILEVLSGDKIATEFSFQKERGNLSFDNSEAFWKLLENLEDEIKPEYKNIQLDPKMLN